MVIEKLQYTDLELSQKYTSGYTTLVYESESAQDMLFKEVRALSFEGKKITQYDRAFFSQEVGGDLSVLLNSRYGLTEYIPSTKLAWGKSHPLLQAETGFIVMEKVKGVRIQDAKDLDIKIAEDLDLLLSRSIALGMDNLHIKKGIRRIPDVLNCLGFINIVIGTTSENNVRKPYFVDTYPATVTLDNDWGVWIEAIGLLSDQSQGYGYERTKKKIELFFRSPQLRRRE